MKSGRASIVIVFKVTVPGTIAVGTIAVEEAAWEQKINYEREDNAEYGCEPDIR